MFAVFLALVHLIAGVAGTNKTCLVSDFLSLQPQSSDATPGIQAAVNACNAGGTVLFDNRITATSGRIILSGSVHVHIPDGLLVASANREAYPGPQSAWYLLHFLNCHNCSLTGSGTLDGQGLRWVTGRAPDGSRSLVQNFVDNSCVNPAECRPRLVGVVNSSHVALEGLNLVDPVYWCVHLVNSSHVRVQNITIQGDWNIPNNDGIDIDSSSDVEVTGAHISTADDAICIKTTLPGVPAQRVRVSHSVLRSRSSAVKLGSESVADFADLAFHDLRVQDSHRGLAVQLRDGGSVRNVSFQRIQLTTRYMQPSWWGGAEPVYVTAVPRQADSAVGTVTGLTFTDIAAVSENGVFIAGSAQSTVRDVTLRNVTLLVRRKTAWPGGQQDFRPSSVGVLTTGSTAALWVEHSEGVLFDNVQVAVGWPRRRDLHEDFHDEGNTTRAVVLRQCSFRFRRRPGRRSAGGAVLRGGRPRKIALA